MYFAILVIPESLVTPASLGAKLQVFHTTSKSTVAGSLPSPQMYYSKIDRSTVSDDYLTSTFFLA